MQLSKNRGYAVILACVSDEARSCILTLLKLTDLFLRNSTQTLITIVKSTCNECRGGGGRTPILGYNREVLQ